MKLLIIVTLAVLVIHLIFQRVNEKKQENFEDRDY